MAATKTTKTTKSKTSMTEAMTEAGGTDYRSVSLTAEVTGVDRDEGVDAATHAVATMDAIVASGMAEFRATEDDAERARALVSTFYRLPSEADVIGTGEVARVAGTSRMTLLRAYVPVADRLHPSGQAPTAEVVNATRSVSGTETDLIKKVLAKTASQCSQVRRGVTRTAEYDRLAIPEGQRVSLTQREKMLADDWKTHIAGLVASPEQDENTSGDGEPTAEAEAEAVASTVTPEDRANTALDTLAAVLPELDAESRVRVAARLASLMRGE